MLYSFLPTPQRHPRVRTSPGSLQLHLPTLPQTHSKLQELHQRTGRSRNKKETRLKERNEATVTQLFTSPRDPESPTFLKHISLVLYPLSRPRDSYSCLAQDQPREPHSQQNQASWVWHRGGGSAYGHPVEVRNQGFESVFPHFPSAPAF